MVDKISSAQIVIGGLFLAVVIGAVPGCGGGRPGFPKQSLDEKALIADLEDKFGLPTKIKDYYDVKAQLQKANNPNTFSVLTDGQRELLKTKRDEIISARLALINLNYNQFVADESFNRQMFNLTTDLADLGVDIASTAFNAESTKTILSAISASLSGTQTAVGKHIYFEKTVTALVTAMNARRRQAMIPIIEGALKPVDNYPLDQALSDLDVYYFSGTFLGALDYIRTTASVQEREASDKIIEIQVNNDPEVRNLRRSIYIWLRIAGNRQKLTAEVARQFNNAPYLDWLQTAPTTDLKKVMGLLSIPEQTKAQLDADGKKNKAKLDKILEEKEKTEAAKKYITDKTLAITRGEINSEFGNLGVVAQDAALEILMVGSFVLKKNDHANTLGINFTFIASTKGVH